MSHSLLRPQHTQQAMNLAIDRLLDDDARDALDAQLDRSPGDAALWTRMQRVDRMLRSAAHLQAPQSFSARLMQAIAAGRQPRRDPRYSLGMAIGLWVAAAITIPLLGGALLLIASAVLDSAALQGVLTALIRLAHDLSALALALTNAADSFIAANPVIVVATLLSVPALAVGGWLMRPLVTHDPSVTYRIPVRVMS